MSRAVVLLLLASTVTGCAPTFAERDMRWHSAGDTLYVFARSEGVSRGLCASLGDVAFAEARLAADDGRRMQLGRVSGCHTIRHIIVCTEYDAACVVHEERHRSQGAFHP